MRIHNKASGRCGFTLVEMLVVIAIIAILVAVIIPTVSSSASKAKAATDAANLRNAVAVGNVGVYNDDLDLTISDLEKQHFVCKSFPGASLQIVYFPPVTLNAYYVVGDNYYGIDYFSAAATGGDVEAVSTAKPTFGVGGGERWIPIGDAE